MSGFQSLLQAGSETFCSYIFHLHSNLKLSELIQIHIRYITKCLKHIAHNFSTRFARETWLLD